MALTPLTPAQLKAVDEFVARGRLAVVPADQFRALTFMRQASDVIADLPHLTKPQNGYNLAYDARRFDQLRRARNQQRYDARPVGNLRLSWRRRRHWACLLRRGGVFCTDP